MYNAAGDLVNAAEFPIAWSSSAPGVVRIGRDDGYRSAYVDGVAPGTATVAARAEGGVSGSLTIAVGIAGGGETGGVFATRPDLPPVEPVLLDRPAETRTVDVPQLRLDGAFAVRTFKVPRLALAGRFGPRRIINAQSMGSQTGSFTW